MSNINVRSAAKIKDDEFYTCYEDIASELIHYKDQLKGKSVYCNCDSIDSNFWKYLVDNFHLYGLKSLTATSLEGFRYDYDGTSVITSELSGDDLLGATKGNCFGSECISILKDIDIVITNPPFSSWRAFFTLLIFHNKDFLIMGNPNAVVYKEIFPSLKDNKVRLGYYYGNASFVNSPKLVKICWFTTLSVDLSDRFLSLTKHYNTSDYLKYDNYDAINVDRVCDIPKDYSGNIGVPISFMSKYNPNQFELVDAIARYSALGITPESLGKYLTSVNGVHKYARLIIRIL